MYMLAGDDADNDGTSLTASRTCAYSYSGYSTPKTASCIPFSTRAPLLAAKLGAYRSSECGITRSNATMIMRCA